MLRTIVIDDEENIRILLRDIIESQCPDIEIVAEAASVAEAYENIKTYKPDLILLDIRLGDGTGLGLLEKIENIDFKVIFITAYEEYALKALKMSTVDYILKPVIPGELVAAIERAQLQIGAGKIMKG